MEIILGTWGKESRRKVWVQTLLENIERALAEKRFAFALRFCDELLREDPQNLQGWLIRGHLAWKLQKDNAKAIECYRQVLILGGYESSNVFVAQARTCLTQLLELGS